MHLHFFCKKTQLLRSLISFTSFNPGNKNHQITDREIVKAPPNIIAGTVPIKLAEKPALKSPS